MNTSGFLKMRWKPEKREIFDIIVEKLAKQFVTSANKFDATRIVNIIQQDALVFFKNHRISNDNMKKLK